MIKFKISLALFLFSLSVYSQYYSYDEYRIETKMFLDIALSSEEGGYLIIAVLPDYALSTFIVLPKNGNKSLLEAFEKAGCTKCEVFKEEIIDKNPVDYIFNEIEEGRVYKITEHKDKFLVTEYRSQD